MPHHAGTWQTAPVATRRLTQCVNNQQSGNTGLPQIAVYRKVALTELLNSLDVVYLTPASYEIAIQLRQQQKITLGDSLIAATCLEKGYALATCNMGDFNWIGELKVFNPL